MKSESRLGVFFLVAAALELIGLVSAGSTIWLLIRTGFVLEGALLLLVKASSLKHLLISDQSESFTETFECGVSSVSRGVDLPPTDQVHRPHDKLDLQPDPLHLLPAGAVRYPPRLHLLLAGGRPQARGQWLGREVYLSILFCRNVSTSPGSR